MSTCILHLDSAAVGPRLAVKDSDVAGVLAEELLLATAVPVEEAQP